MLSERSKALLDRLTWEVEAVEESAEWQELFRSWMPGRVSARLACGMFHHRYEPRTVLLMADGTALIQSLSDEEQRAEDVEFKPLRVGPRGLEHVLYLMSQV